MRSDKIIPGVVLILVGAAILLHNYDVIHFHWGNFFHLWPIFFVVGGINLIFADKHSGWATALKLGVIILGFGVIIFGSFGRHGSIVPAISYYSDDDDGNDKTATKYEGNHDFSTPYTSDAKIATLNISGGGATYSLSDTTNQLVSAVTRGVNSTYLLSSHEDGDSTYIVNLKMRSHKGFDFNFDDDNNKGKGNDTSHNNSAVFKLNPNPEWNINVKTGAASLQFDLSKFKVRSVKLTGGAAEFNVKMGQPLANTNVTVETGMSDVTVNVPATAACHIKSSTGLSSTNFDGFTKVSDNTYETPGFSTAKNKMFVKINGGMADFKVKRY